MRLYYVSYLFEELYEMCFAYNENKDEKLICFLLINVFLMKPFVGEFVLNVVFF